MQRAQSRYFLNTPRIALTKLQAMPIWLYWLLQRQITHFTFFVDLVCDLHFDCEIIQSECKSQTKSTKKKENVKLYLLSAIDCRKPFQIMK